MYVFKSMLSMSVGEAFAFGMPRVHVCQKDNENYKSNIVLSMTKWSNKNRHSSIPVHPG